MNDIKEILSNKETGLKWLYEKFGRKLLGYAMHVYKLQEDAAWDQVYKTIYKILEVEAKYDFENEQMLGSFIFRVFINYLKNYLRDEQTKTNGAQFISLEESKHDFLQKPDKSNNSLHLKLLKEELDQLQDWQRILLLMRSQDTSYAEIAKFVNKPEEQLKVYYQRLKNALAEKLKEKLNEQEALKNVTRK